VNFLAYISFGQVINAGCSGHLDVELFRVQPHRSQHQLNDVDSGLIKLTSQ